jgi:hypothetical protein
VFSLASNLGATIIPGLRVAGASGMLEAVTLSPKISGGSDKSFFFPGSGDEDPDLPPFTFNEERPTPDTSTASLEIYTIYTGNYGSIDPDLKSIALSTGGDTFNAPNPDDLVKTLLSIIERPADLPKFTLTGSATELWEGDRLAVSLASTKVSSGTPLNWSLTGSGVTASDFSDGITTGIGVVGGDGRYAFSKVLALDALSDPNESLDVKFFSDADRKTQIGSTLSILIKERITGLPTDRADTIRGTVNPSSSREIISGVPIASTQRGKQSIDILTGLGGPDTFVLGDATGTWSRKMQIAAKQTPPLHSDGAQGGRHSRAKQLDHEEIWKARILSI